MVATFFARSRPIADLTASVEADGTLERMMGLAWPAPVKRIASSE
jgi:hypothetical protein